MEIQYGKDMKGTSSMRVKGSPSMTARLLVRTQPVKMGAGNQQRALGGMCPGEKQTKTLNNRFDHVENHTEKHFINLLEVVERQPDVSPKNE